MSKSSIANQTFWNWRNWATKVEAHALVVIAASAFGIGWVPAALAQGSPIRLQDNAPDRYIVEKGDTLWGIAGKFLKEPWRWPEIWKMNQAQIRNPNRIYPGNVIILDRSKSPPELSMGNSVRLSPQVRGGPITELQAIPTIPAAVIEPFLTKPLVIENGGLDNAARIVGTQESRVNLGAGGVAYVTGINDTSGASTWNVYRPGKDLIDPDTNQSLGVEAIFLGTARLTRSGSPATVEIMSSKQEISVGDRLVAAPPAEIVEYVPHAPQSRIQGRIIGLYNGLPTSETGRSSVVAINKGKRDGLENGHVLAILRAGSTVADPNADKSRDTAPTFKLPDERYGVLFLFRVFNAVSYGLVMESSRPVAPSDIVQTP